MGVYRTLNATQSCLKCKDLYACSIQFKTGDDGDMAEYGIECVAHDLAPGLYEGIADAFCPACEQVWAEDEKYAHFNCLAQEVAKNLVSVRRAAWQYGIVDGQPELGLILTFSEDSPLTAEQVLDLAKSTDDHTRPNFAAHLSNAGVTLWIGTIRITPDQPHPQSATAYETWMHSHDLSVESMLQTKGWVNGSDPFSEVIVEVTANQGFCLR